MADLSLDELIRLRGLNAKGTNSRPTFQRGAGGERSMVGAREKIGVVDARQSIVSTGGGGREKLAQKDARFKIKRGAVGGGVQDARQTINLRKQQTQDMPQLEVRHPSQRLSHTHTPKIQLLSHNGNGTAQDSNVELNTRGGLALQGGGPKKMMDARDRLSLKRSVVVALPTPASPTPLKITKTIQQPVGLTSAFRINIPNRNTQSLSGEDGVSPSKQKKPGVIASPFSGPITKVVQNDTYKAPVPAAPEALSRSTPAVPASGHAPPTIKAISHTLATGQAQQGGGATACPAAAQPVCSPLEGTKMTVNNLHPRVTEEDIMELFCVCGALKRVRLLREGVAEVVFVRKEDAVTAYRKYNNRCLDGQPMKCSLHIQGNVISSDQQILLSDSPGGAGGDSKKEGLPPSLSRPRGRSSSSQPTPEVDPATILKALFKSSPQSLSTTESS
ncbi:polymerase delta-interacting protein 3-like isoform X2 [Megalops cyprinoides]|uniref:polymerase delta-interacting protein 3-like isoform X2 n=1 Tax=Megalops cyprinoides TaxID=118141 RepID=UPI001864BC39|nr:polymerase delta-interacting protein 3-like isoform X2 [Megalops cyprinoides]